MGHSLNFRASGLAVWLLTHRPRHRIRSWYGDRYRIARRLYQLRVTAHTSYCWYLPTIPMLVHHAVDDWTTAFSSAEACRSTPAHPCRALGLTPEQCEAEVLLTVCIAVVVGGHGRVATAHQIAPWSRGSDLLSPTAVGAAFQSTSVGGLSRF